MTTRSEPIESALRKLHDTELAAVSAREVIYSLVARVSELDVARLMEEGERRLRLAAEAERDAAVVGYRQRAGRLVRDVNKGSNEARQGE